LVWAVAKKKDVLWVNWVYERYIEDKNWWEYKPPHDSSWYWKKTCRVKEEFKRGCTEPLSWDWEGGSEYKVSKGYAWLKQPQRKNPWAKIIWARPNLPRKAFISWVMINHRLPTKQRIAKHQNFTDITCVLCCAEDEIDEHLFFTCSYAKEIWGQPSHWWASLPSAQDSNQLLRYMRKAKDTRVTHQVTSSIITAILYHIWSARNQRIFRNQQLITSQIVYLIKDQVKS